MNIPAAKGTNSVHTVKRWDHAVVVYSLGCYFLVSFWTGKLLPRTTQRKTTGGKRRRNNLTTAPEAEVLYSSRKRH